MIGIHLKIIFLVAWINIAVFAEYTGSSRESGEPPRSFHVSHSTLSESTVHSSPQHITNPAASQTADDGDDDEDDEDEDGYDDDDNYSDDVDIDDPSVEEEMRQFTNWVLNRVESSQLVELDYAANKQFLDSLPGGWRLVYPVQVRSKSQLMTLSTSDPKRQGTHFRHTSFDIRINNVHYKLRLELNRNLLSRNLQQKQSLDAKTQIIQEGSLEACFYQGHVKKVPASLVAVSTCQGISGMVRIHGSDYIIRPLDMVHDVNETRHPHVIFSSQNHNLSCGNDHGIWQHYSHLHSGEFLRKMKIAKAQASGDWGLGSASKRAEVAMIADHSLFSRMNRSLPSTLTYMAEIANIADLLWQAGGVRLSLTVLEVWTVQDMVSVSSHVRQTLTEVIKYRQKSAALTQVDASLLITAVEFTHSELGIAVPASVCSSRAVGIVKDQDSTDSLQVAVGVSHMIGHILGLEHADHDNTDCSDDNVNNHVMATRPRLTADVQHGFLSACSQQALHTVFMAGLGSCLLPQTYEETYSQQCGNGIVERGEECDCRDALECVYDDPCCDASTCLLKSWATCRHGDCCYNCTVIPRSYECRAALTECDVPEYCDGKSGQCPTNALYQDGQTCQDGLGLCYHGNCHSYSDQCQDIWGSGAIPADDKCFERFNPDGKFNGHCGLNFTLNEYLRCSPEDVKCGLLHCSGGDDEPKFGHKDAFSVINMKFSGVQYQCKNLNGHTASLQLPQIGMVEDGTPCGAGFMCVASHCVSITSIITQHCPHAGPHNLTCSGHGVCSSEVKCVCFMDYEGHDCSKVKVKTLDTTAVPSTNKSGRVSNKMEPTTAVLSDPVMTTTQRLKTPLTEGRNVSIQWLVIVLAGVAGGTLLLFVCCFMCYRRKSPQKNKKKKQKHLFGSVASFSSVNSKKPENCDIAEPSNRIISFGNMPSYRADKIKKFQKALAGIQSGTGSESEQSRGDRSSAEVKVASTLPMVKSQPERGILKKYPRSADDLQSNSELEPLRNSPVVPSSPRMGTRSRANNRNPLRSEVSGGQNSAEDVKKKNPLDRNSFQFIDEQVQCDEDDEASCCSCQSCSNHGDDCSQCGLETSQLLQASTEQGAAACQSSEGSGDSLQGTRNKIVKLRNINDLLKQIDEQFNSVLLQSGEHDMSPVHSAGSETEADRNFPRDSFYKQSDIEEGYSPPHRSPILSPNPNRYSCGVSSPEQLPSPTATNPSVREKVSSQSSAGHLSKSSLPHRSEDNALNITQPSHSSPNTSLNRASASSSSRTPSINSEGSAQKQTDCSDQPVDISSLKTPPCKSSGSGGSAQEDSPGRVTAVPYRGVQMPAHAEVGKIKGETASSSSLTPPTKHKTTPPGYQKPSPPSSVVSKSPQPAKKGIFKSSPKLSKFAHPIFDGYPFKKRGSSSNDGQSVSEGYHSDRHDDSIIIREIPPVKPTELRFSPDPSGAYTKCPGSPGSPDDIDV